MGTLRGQEGRRKEYVLARPDSEEKSVKPIVNRWEAVALELAGTRLQALWRGDEGDEVKEPRFCGQRDENFAGNGKAG